MSIILVLLLLLATPAEAQFTQCDPATVSYDDLLSRRCIIMSRAELQREIRRFIKALESDLKFDARKCARVVNDQKYLDCIKAELVKSKRERDASP